MRARFEFVGDDVHAIQAFEIHVAVGENLVEDGKQPQLRSGHDSEPNETAQVHAQVHGAIRVRLELEGTDARGWSRGGCPYGLEFDRRD